LFNSKPLQVSFQWRGLKKSILVQF
jgi:hypothetical protein